MALQARNSLTFYIWLLEQVMMIVLATVTICSCGMFFLEYFDLVTASAISMQPTMLARGSICLLMGDSRLDLLFEGHKMRRS